jgi:hypothetical protein
MIAPRIMSDAAFEEHCNRTDRVIRAVFVYPNGMCAVTDQFGQQMPEFQGRWAEVEKKVREAAGSDVEWNGVG